MKFVPYGHQWIDREDIEKVVKVLESDWLTTGPKIAEFENAVCKYIRCKYAVAVNSGTSALDIAVQTLNLSKGSEIITTPFTFIATPNAILYNNLKPIFADIERDTKNINPDEIRKKITDKTKAIICVDYAGHPCDIDEIKKIAKEHNLFLIGDGCHAIGAEYKGKKVGSLADMTVFSFHPVKAITTGEGGMVTTNNKQFYERLKMLRNHGINKTATERQDWQYDMLMLGRNYRMTDSQAALGISQLRKIDKFIKRKEEIVELYTDAFATVDGMEVPTVKSYAKHAWHIYTILVDGRNAFFNRMREKRIGVNLHYIPVYRFSYYREQFNVNPMEFPVTEEVFSKIVTLPLFSKMTDDEVLNIIEIVKESIIGQKDLI